jgi:hypothetical protein
MNSIQPNHKFQSSKYKLTVKDYHGNGADSFKLDDTSLTRNGMKFSTFDQDNDQHSGHCASKSGSFGGGAGWWNECGYENLNGLNYGHAKTSNSKCMSWWDWGRKWECLKSITMAIRPI